MLYVDVDELLLLDLIGEVDAGGDWVRSGLLSQPQGEDSVVETEAEQQRRAGST